MQSTIEEVRNSLQREIDALEACKPSAQAEAQTPAEQELLTTVRRLNPQQVRAMLVAAELMAVANRA